VIDGLKCSNKTYISLTQIKDQSVVAVCWVKMEGKKTAFWV